MMREPDWESLNDLNFLVYTRLANTLNAALSALELADTPGLDDQTPLWWRERAHTKVTGTLSTLMAWSWLIQHKNGMQLPQQAIRSFPLQNTVNWLSEKLQLDGRGQAPSSLILEGNQETFQEAILLLHSVATSQGSGVKVAWEQKGDNVEFTCSFKRRRRREPYADLEALLNSFKGHWRSQLTLFELQIAQHLLELSHAPLGFKDDGQFGEFHFVLVGATKNLPPQIVPIRRTNGKIVSQDLPTDLKKQIRQVKHQISTQISHSEVVASLPLDNATVELDFNDTPVFNEEELQVATPTPPETQVLQLKETTPTGNWQTEKSEEQKGIRKMPANTSGDWQATLDYENIDWNTLGFLNDHTYHRLTNPLIKAMGHLDTARLVREDKAEFEKTLDQAYDHLERMVTSMKAWATLTDWRNHHLEPHKKTFAPTDFPDWFTRQIKPHVKFSPKNTLSLNVHHDAFIESILILAELTQHIGTLNEITLQDRKKKQGVWLRIAFTPPPERRYTSRLDILDSFIRTNPAGDELAVRYAVADDLFKMNGTHFALQENQKTGEQAFAIMFPVEAEALPKKKITTEVSPQTEKAQLVADKTTAE